MTRRRPRILERRKLCRWLKRSLFPAMAPKKALEAKLQGMGKDVTLTIHPGTAHAFMAPHNALGTLNEEVASVIWPQSDRVRARQTRLTATRQPAISTSVTTKVCSRFMWSRDSGSLASQPERQAMETSGIGLSLGGGTTPSASSTSRASRKASTPAGTPA